jgi:serine/threonine-protein kinase
MAAEVGATFALLRNYPEAERFYNRAISLDPEVPDFHAWKADLYLLWDGSTERAGEVLRKAREHIAEDAMIVELLLLDILDKKYEEALKRLTSVSSETVRGGGFASSYTPTVQYLAEVYGLMGNHQKAQSNFDSARVFLEDKIQESPTDPALHSALGIAYAGLGRSEDAIREGKLGVELLPISKEAIGGYARAQDLARIYSMVGEYDAAVDQLEYLLSIPGDLSAAWLRLDPTWGALRDHPRFQELTEG